MRCSRSTSARACGVTVDGSLSNISRSPVSGVRNWWETSAENARSRASTSAMRALLVASVSPSRSNSATPVGVGGEHDTAGAELLGGLGESLHGSGEPSGEGPGEQPGDQQRAPARRRP